MAVEKVLRVRCVGCNEPVEIAADQLESELFCGDCNAAIIVEAYPTLLAAREARLKASAEEVARRAQAARLDREAKRLVVRERARQTLAASKSAVSESARSVFLRLRAASRSRLGRAAAVLCLVVCISTVGVVVYAREAKRLENKAKIKELAARIEADRIALAATLRAEEAECRKSVSTLVVLCERLVSDISVGISFEDHLKRVQDITYATTECKKCTCGGALLLARASASLAAIDFQMAQHNWKRKQEAILKGRDDSIKEMWEQGLQEHWKDAAKYTATARSKLDEPNTQ